MIFVDDEIILFVGFDFLVKYIVHDGLLFAVMSLRFMSIAAWDEGKELTWNMKRILGN